MQNLTKHQGPWPFSTYKQIDATNTDLPQDVTVVVVDGGIAGVIAALLLAETGRKVALIETRDTLGGGDTARTAAHITALLDTPYSTLIKNFGETGAR